MSPSGSRCIHGTVEGSILQQLYENHIIVYLDIIGFQAKVHDAQDDHQKIKSIAEKLGEVKQMVTDINMVARRLPAVRAQMFSDTILLTYPNPRARSLVAMASLVSRFQANLMKDGHFLRGSAVIGDHYEDSEVMFGPALIQATELESLAAWPRVLVHPEILEKAGEVMAAWLRRYAVFRDEDGIAYLNYLQYAFLMSMVQEWTLEFQEKKSIDPPSLELLTAHKAAVLNAVRGQMDLSILSKYHSVASYHNRVIESLYNWLPPEFEKRELAGREELARFYQDVKTGFAQLADAINEDRLEDFLDRKFNELCELRHAIKDVSIVMQEAFPALYGEHGWS